MRPPSLFLTRDSVHRALLCALLSFCAIASRAHAQAETSPPVPTLEVFQRLAEEIAGRVADSLLAHDALRVAFTMLPRTEAWFLEKGIARAFTQRGHVVTDASSSRVAVDFGTERLGIIYTDLRRSWFFGARAVTRTAHLKMTVKLTMNEPGRAIVQRDFAAVSSDSVFVGDIPELESPIVPATHGVLPEEGFLSNPVEAVILTGAVGVAVFLLFNVRS
jgi:hypothetical protein